MDSEETASTAIDAKVMGTPSTQREAKPGEVEVLPPLDRGGITPIPLTKTLQEIGQIKSEAAMMLLCSHASRLEADLQETGQWKVHAAKSSSKI